MSASVQFSSGPDTKVRVNAINPPKEINFTGNGVTVVDNTVDNRYDVTITGAGVGLATTTVAGVVELATNGETAANVVVQGNDSRLSNARTPTTHASTHKSGGSDPIRLDELAAAIDVNTLNASTGTHGLLPKLSGDATTYLNGSGAFSVPPGSTPGEVNTYSNAGLAGVPIILTKTGVDLPFKAIDAATNKISVTNDATNKTVDIDVTEANLSIANMTGSIGDARITDLAYSKLSSVPTTIVKTDQANTFGAFDQTVPSTRLKLSNSGFSSALSVGTLAGNTTLTLPSGTETVVGRTTTDTLTNKTINATNNTITDSSTALGDILKSDGTKFTRLGVGTANQVLTVNGGATDILWADTISNAVGRSNYDYLVYYSGTRYEAINKTGTVAFFNTTDAGAVINSCINAIQPSSVANAVDKQGTIVLASGIFTILTTIVPKNHICIEGSGMQSTLLQLGSTLNIDMIKSFGFASLTGTNSQYGTVDVTIRNLSLDGQAWNNLTAGCGIRKYGFAWLLENVEIKNFREQGIYTEWCTNGATLYGPDDVHEQQEQWRNCQFLKNFGGGILHRGPHDSTMSNSSVTGNWIYGIKLEFLNNVYSGELHLHQCHIWDQNGTNSIGIWVASGGIHFTDLIIETVDDAAAGGIGLYCQGGYARGTYLWVYMCDTGVKIENPGPCSLQNCHIHSNTTGMIVAGNDHYITGRLIDNNNVANTAGTGLQMGVTGTVVTRNFIELEISGSKTQQILWVENHFDNFLILLVNNAVGQRTVTETVAANLGTNAVQILESGTGTNSGWGRPVNEVSASTLYNKTISAGGNNLFEAIVSPVIRKTGTYTPTAGTIATTVGSLYGMLASLAPTTPTGGSATNTYDTTEKSVMANFITSTTSGQTTGLLSSASGVGMGRRLQSMRAKIKFKVDTVAGSVSRFYFGFTSATALPTNTDSPLAATDNGFIVGWGAADTNYQIWSNDGATSATKTQASGPVAKDTAFHTIEIAWPAAGNITAVIDDSSFTTISTDLPVTTANLFFNVVMQNATAAARTLTIKAVYIEENWR